MTSLYRAHRLIDTLAHWPPLQRQLQRRYEHHFCRARGKAHLFRGVFDSFAAAQDSAPPAAALGYNNADAAALYLERSEQIYPGDYPVLFWLSKLLAGSPQQLLDLGGHIGVSYYAYRRYLDYPAKLRWNVHDVAAVMERGRILARDMDGSGQLQFCARIDELDAIDLLLALGSLQYLPDTLAQRLARLPALPPHLLLAAVPIHARQSYFTLQNMGSAFCPYRITAMEEFVASFEAMGYQLIDRWESPEKSCLIPFHPQHSLERYHGFYFRRQAL